ncbi:hypothetical protein SAM19_04686 [Brevibacillus laterosporus]|nr:hypothetical protein [Brevibacillus laterosporus]
MQQKTNTIEIHKDQLYWSYIHYFAPSYFVGSLRLTLIYGLVSIIFLP